MTWNIGPRRQGYWAERYAKPMENAKENGYSGDMNAAGPDNEDGFGLGVIRFRKRPVAVEAVQILATDFNGRSWDGSPFSAGPEWLIQAIGDGRLVPVTPNGTDYAEWEVRTLEDGYDGRAKHVATPGDWIIRGVKGELYPCKDEIFRATYEPASAPQGEE